MRFWWKTSGWLLVVGLLASRADAALPETLAGRTLYTAETLATVGLRAYGAAGYVFLADGRFRQLYAFGWDITRATGGWQAPDEGTYDYAATGATTGVIRLRMSSGTEDLLRLSFTADDHGTIEPASPLVLHERTFRAGGDVSAPAPLANSSLRATVAPGGVAIAGFVIAGRAQRAVLVRAVGAGLTAFGVSGALANPRLRVTGVGAPLDTNDDWHVGNAVESVRRIEALTGAFPLAANSLDAATILPALAPGAYTVQVDSATPGAAGEVLIEVYLLP